MKTKTCRSCGKEKQIKDFCTRHRVPTSKCKPCKNKYMKQWRKASKEKNNRDIEYHIYYLPEHHYIGFTRNIVRRMRQHRYQGRLTKGYELIASYKHPAAALMMEAMFHLNGYYGCKYSANNEKGIYE